MKFKVNKSKCAGCGACLRACPHGAIKIGKDGKAFIDQGKCKKCGTCQRICPFNTIEKIPEKEEQEKPMVKTPSYGFSSPGGKGMGAGKGRGLGRGPRNGRGEGRGGGGRRR